MNLDRNQSKKLNSALPFPQPAVRGPSLTHVDPLCDLAFITQHIAAPVEAAMTALNSCLPEYVVPTATTQAATAIQQTAGLVAGPAPRAWGAHGGVSLTEVRRLLKVNQLS